jgi:gluconate 5-dehydrogenase
MMLIPGFFATAQIAPGRVDSHPFNDFHLGHTPASDWELPGNLNGTFILLDSP